MSILLKTVWNSFNRSYYPSIKWRVIMLHYHSQDTASFKFYYKNVIFICLKIIGQVAPLIITRAMFLVNSRYQFCRVPLIKCGSFFIPSW